MSLGKKTNRLVIQVDIEFVDRLAEWKELMEKNLISQKDRIQELLEKDLKTFRGKD